jgi:hypothetical protein
MNSLYLSDLLKIEADVDEFIGFKFGVKGISNNRINKKSLVNIRYIVTEELDSGRVESLSMELDQKNRKYVHRERKLLFGNKALLTVDFSNEEMPIVSVNKWYLLWSNLRGTSAFQTPEQILETISFVKLIEKGALPMHCGAVEKDGKGYLLIAPSNTGKTLTTAKLTKEYGFKFIAEDIAILKDNIIYGCPYTATDIPPHLNGPKPKKKNFINRLLFPKQRKSCVADCFDENQILQSAPLSGIFFLKRSSGDQVKDVTKTDALECLDKNNSLEFKYKDDDILGELWFRYGQPSLRKIADVEYSRLETIANSDIFLREIVASDPSKFCELIAKEIKE